MQMPCGQKTRSSVKAFADGGLNAAECRYFGSRQPAAAGQSPVSQHVAGAGEDRPSGGSCRMVQQRCPRSSRFVILIPQQATESFPTLDVAQGTPHLVTSRSCQGCKTKLMFHPMPARIVQSSVLHPRLLPGRPEGAVARYANINRH